MTVLVLFLLAGIVFYAGWICREMVEELRTCTYCADPKTHPHPDGGPGGVCDRHAKALGVSQ